VIPIPALKPIPFSFFVNRESIFTLEDAPASKFQVEVEMRDNHSLVVTGYFPQ